MQTAVAQSESAVQWSDPSPHEIRFVTVAPDVQLEVLDWGGSGEPLVFLAGLSMNAHAFDDFAPRFTDTHRVVGITRRGHGASSWPDEGYSLERRIEDIRVVLDTLGLERVVFAGHSLAGKEITRFAGDYPERVAGLVYIDAANDPTLIERLRLMELCPVGPEILAAIERMFENPEAFRHTQRRETADGTLGPFASDIAIAQLIASFSTPHDYSAVRSPALAVYHSPRRLEDVFGGEAILSPECVSAMQRYIYEGIAGFAVGMERGRIVAIDDSQHNIHLVSPDALEEVMRRWLADLPEEPVSLTVNSESATVDTTHSDTVEEEARQFMAGYAKDLLSHDPDAIAERYSRRGTYVVFPGDWNLQPHDSIASMYRERWQGPEAFEWHDLSYEVIGEDAVAVIGGFRFETDENSGVLGTYTALLVREDGELRIRLENESFDNLPPDECEAQEEPCDMPLERTAMERYIGEYKVTGQEDSTRVYEEDGSLMIHPPSFPPTRLLYRGGDEFRLAEYPGIRLQFDGAGERAMSYIVLSGMVLGTGNRYNGSDNAGADGKSLSRRNFDALHTTTSPELHKSGFHTDTTKVMSAANNFLKAFNNLEWETFYNSFSPSATVFQPFGNSFRHNNREELAEFFRSLFSQIKSTTEGPPYLTIIPQDLRIQMIGEAAIVTFHLPGNKVGRRTLVFSRNGLDDTWQIVHLHASLLEELEKIGSHKTLKDSIVSVTQNLASAWIRLDPEEYLSYFSDDMIFYFQGARFTRDNFEVTVRESMNALRESTFEIHDPEVKVLGPDAAVITFRLHETMIDKSENITIINGMLSLFYERHNGQWQVVRAHESLSGNGESQE